MLQTYITPSIQDHDFSRFQFAKNQATCDPATVINGEDFAIEFDFGTCGFGVNDNRADICLSGDVNDVSQLESLILRDNFGGQFVISSCSEGGTTFGTADCDGTAYRCSGSGDLNGNCILSMTCPDGTLISTCDPLNSNCSTDGFFE